MKIRQIKAIVCVISMVLCALAVNLPARAADAALTTEEKQTDNANSFRYKNGEKRIHNDESLISDPDAISASAEGGNYLASGVLTRGIDVSRHNGNIDWTQVKNSGMVDFVIIRCGYGDDYQDQDDEKWLEYTTACERLGIPYGVYLYSYATNLKHAQSEAAHAIRLLQGRHPSMPIYLDMEDASTQNLGRQMLSDIADTFCDALQEEGYDVGVYSSLYWWNNLINTSVFDNPSWSKWIAQWSAQCDYTKEYDMWQYSDKGQIPGIPGDTDLNVWVADNKSVNVSDKNIITYRTNMVANGKQTGGGWQSWVSNGMQSNTVASANHIEGLQMKVGSGYGDLGIAYRVFNGKNWLLERANGVTAGKPGTGDSVQAIRIRLTGNAAANYDIYYRVKSYASGWSNWAKNGTAAGTRGYDRYAKAIQVVVVKKGEAAPEGSGLSFSRARLAYTVYSQTYGWLSTSYDGEVAGAVGLAKRVEGIQVKNVSECSGEVTYQVYSRGYGWRKQVADGKTSGVLGKSCPIEAMKLNVSGDFAKTYDVYYRVNMSRDGWLDWAKNGGPTGMVGYDQQIEAIEVRIVKKGKKAPGDTKNTYYNANEREKSARVCYQTHIQNIGWEAVSKIDNEISGTTGLGYHLEALMVHKGEAVNSIAGDIQYKVYSPSYGWKAWVKNGAVAGTTGKSQRIEAFRVKLTGKLAEKYDVYYRAHVQNYGWLAWAKNGTVAGTTGYGYRMEAVQIRLIKKGGKVPANTGTETKNYLHPNIGYRTHVQSIGWLANSYDGAVNGTEGKSLRMESVIIDNLSGVSGDIRYRVHVQNYGWMGWKSSGQLAGTTGESKRMEAIQIKLTGTLAEKYDVYYRVHAQQFGWLDWAKNGKAAGTSGFSYRLESLQIVLVKKGDPAPGKTTKPYVKQ